MLLRIRRTKPCSRCACITDGSCGGMPQPWPLQRQGIRRRTDLRRQCNSCADPTRSPNPRIGADRIVAVQADRACRARAPAPARRSSCSCASHCRYDVEFDLRRMLGREARGRRAIRRRGTPRASSASPRRSAERRAKIPVERIEARMHLQELPPRGNEGAEAARRARCPAPDAVAKIAVQQFENLEFQFRHAAIIDQIRGAQLASAARAMPGSPMRCPRRRALLHIPAPAARRCTAR